MANKKESSRPKKISAHPGINRPAWLSVAVISIVTFITFSPCLQNSFTNVDDDVYVLNNPLVINKTVPVKEIFVTPVSLNYHPLTILSLALNYQAGKLDPAWYHFINVLFHILNTVLVFFFIFLLTRRNLLMASIVALFFGIHPMHVESVAWVSERKDMLYVFFFMAGLITYLRYRDNKKVIWYLATLLLFILSCLSKGMAVVFPVILLLVDYFLHVNWERKIILEKIPFFILSIAFGAVAFYIQKIGGAVVMDESISHTQQIFIGFYGLMMYVVKLLVPLNLAMIYPHIVNEKGNLPVMFYLAPVIILLCIALTYFFFRKNRAIVFGLLFYITSVVLVLQFLSVGSAIMADRYSYLSSVGILLVVAYAINRSLETDSFTVLKYPVIMMVVVVALLFSFQTYARTQIWKNSITLWTDEMNKYPNVQFTHYEKLLVELGLAYQDLKKYDLALDDWNSALMLKPDDTFQHSGIRSLEFT